MKRFLFALLVSAAISLPAIAALKQGETAPDFTAEASLAGKQFTYSLKDQLGKGPVVVYFYPSAYTGGCNIQARAFADNKERFAAAGASIVGVSLDSITRLNDFSADPEYCAGKLAVASDADGKIAKAYGLEIQTRAGLKDTRGQEIDHAFAERTTFVVGADGTIVATVGGVTPQENVDQTLAAVERLASAAGKPAARPKKS